MESAPPLSINVDKDGFYMSGFSETRRTADSDDGGATPDVAMREVLAAMPGAMQTSDSNEFSPMRRNPRFKPLREDERKGARADAADARREEAIRIKRRMLEVQRQAEARYVPPVDASCLCMTLVLVVLVGLWLADIYVEYLLQHSRDAPTDLPQQPPPGISVQHEDV